MYRPVDAAAQGFEIAAQPGGRIPEFGQRHLPFAAFQRVDAPEKPRRVGPECPGDVTAAVHEVRHVLHGFPSRGRLRIRDAGAICCRRSAGIAASCMVAAKFSASEARNWVACASESSRAALTPLAFWNAPIWV